MLADFFVNMICLVRMESALSRVAMPGSSHLVSGIPLKTEYSHVNFLNSNSIKVFFKNCNSNRKDVFSDNGTKYDYLYQQQIEKY